MALVNPPGRANYEPNSWDGEAGGPRESPDAGFHSFPAEPEGIKQRIRSATFADHYSQARQFYVSQTKVEQEHIAAAYTFELSKVERPEIRSRMVAHLLNVDRDLGETVGRALGLQSMPKPADAAQRLRDDLKPSPALSIVRNGPERFEGRTLGALLSDGVPTELIDGLGNALTLAKANLEIVAPKIGGVRTSDGSRVQAQQTIAGGPSVLFDAVAILISEDSISQLVNDPAARDYVSDAYAHSKFIAYNSPALDLIKGVLGDRNLDDGFFEIGSSKDCKNFIQNCGKLRYWPRTEMTSKSDKKTLSDIRGRQPTRKAGSK